MKFNLLPWFDPVFSRFFRFFLIFTKPRFYVNGYFSYLFLLCCLLISSNCNADGVGHWECVEGDCSGECSGEECYWTGCYNQGVWIVDRYDNSLLAYNYFYENDVYWYGCYCQAEEDLTCRTNNWESGPPPGIEAASCAGACGEGGSYGYCHQQVGTREFFPYATCDANNWEHGPSPAYTGECGTEEDTNLDEVGMRACHALRGTRVWIPDNTNFGPLLCN